MLLFTIRRHLYNHENRFDYYVVNVQQQLADILIADGYNPHFDFKVLFFFLCYFPQTGLELLPLELWITTFSDLEKIDITECSKVCEPWNRIIKQPISIVLKFDRFQELLHDLEKYPTCGLKVESLKVQSPDHYKGELELLLSILSHCPNLTRLDFTKIRIQRYLKILDSTRVALPCIKNLIVRSKEDMVFKNPELEALLTRLDYKFRRALTRINIENPSCSLYDNYGE